MYRYSKEGRDPGFFQPRMPWPGELRDPCVWALVFASMAIAEGGLKPRVVLAVCRACRKKRREGVMWLLMVGHANVQPPENVLKFAANIPKFGHAD